MGKSSRQKRRTYQTPKRSRTNANFVWYVATAILVLAGTLAVVLSRTNSASGVGPTSSDHWHAALGVDDCGKWAPNWLTPVDPSAGTPVRSGSTIYAGMHSHGDGLIHMEPQTSDEVGRHATLGTYFTMNGFQLSSTHVKFASADLKNGDKCGKLPGKLHWLVNGKERVGDPTKYLLRDSDYIVVAFLPDSKKITSLGKPPSYANLPGAEGRSNSTPTSAVTPPSAVTPSSTSAPAASTSTPASTVAPASTPTS